MAVPTQPDTSSVVTEAYKKVGIDSPTSDQHARGIAHFAPEIINNIWIHSQQSGNTRLKVLQATTTVITTIGDSKYSFPTGMTEEITLSVLDGTYRGTIVGASTENLVTLEPTTTSLSPMSTNEITGKYIFITASSTGAEGQLRQVVGYSTAYNTSDGTTASLNLVTIADNWTISPAGTDTYLIVNNISELNEDHVLDVGGLNESLIPGKPTKYMKIMEDGVESFILDRPPDLATYGILIRYYANPMLLDTCDVVWQRMYLDWWDAVVTGVAWKVAEDQDDSKYIILKAEFEEMRDDIMMREQPWGGEFEGFTL